MCRRCISRRRACTPRTALASAGCRRRCCVHRFSGTPSSSRFSSACSATPLCRLQTWRRAPPAMEFVVPLPFNPLFLRCARTSTSATAAAADWRRRVPRLQSEIVTLRELRLHDAAALAHHLCDPRVRHHLAPGPTSLIEFRRFIVWARTQRRAGALVCFSVVPAKRAQPVGIMQLWSADPAFATAEWGFALGYDHWGSGLFEAAADLLLQFAFCTAGVTRLEALTAASNDRANGALRKLAATPIRATAASGRRAKDDPIIWSVLAS